MTVTRLANTNHEGCSFELPFTMDWRGVLCTNSNRKRHTFTSLEGMGYWISRYKAEESSKGDTLGMVAVQEQF